jgi:hypothetical protein
VAASNALERLIDVVAKASRARPSPDRAPRHRSTHDLLGEHHVRRYDEAALARRLADVPAPARAAFAAAVAQRLFALYTRYADATGTSPQELGDALDGAWDALASAAETQRLEHWRDLAEALVPDEEEEEEGSVTESAYGQNAAAAVAYALRTQLADDPQEAVWAARQLYEAADFAAQHQIPDLDLNDPGAEDALASTAAVQEALAALEEDLAAVAGGAPDDVADVRRRARDGADRLAALVFGDDD